jgi:hypothetical protein
MFYRFSGSALIRQKKVPKKEQRSHLTHLEVTFIAFNC